MPPEPTERMWTSHSSRQLLVRVWRFALASGLGLSVDVGIFMLLIVIGARTGHANLASATTAVALVFWLSTKRIFDYQGRFLFGLFLIYVGYHALAIGTASLAVDRLASLGIVPLLAKILILPVTFSANYLMMAFLTRRRT